MRHILLTLLFFLLFSSSVGAVSVPHTFQPNTPALAAEVNANFQALVDAVNAQQAAITQLQNELASANATISQLQSDLAAAEAGIVNNASDIASNAAAIATNTSAIASNANDISSNGNAISINAGAIAGNATDIGVNASAILDIQNNTVLALDGFLTLEVDGNGYDTAHFDSVNVQITNGLGATNGNPGATNATDSGPVNGLGNLIIGYNETMQIASAFCSVPDFDNQADCVNNGAVWAPSQRTGSHNFILGPGHAYTNHGSLITGTLNIVNGVWGVSNGGTSNMASGESSIVSGGLGNVASGIRSSVSGGALNVASGVFSSISGGFDNGANGSYSSISGGAGNIAAGTASSVSGGGGNIASALRSSVSGGQSNIASGEASSVSGGLSGIAGGQYDWRAGTLFEND